MSGIHIVAPEGRGAGRTKGTAQDTYNKIYYTYDGKKKNGRTDGRTDLVHPAHRKQTSPATAAAALFRFSGKPVVSHRIGQQLCRIALPRKPLLLGLAAVAGFAARPKAVRSRSGSSSSSTDDLLLRFRRPHPVATGSTLPSLCPFYMALLAAVAVAVAAVISRVHQIVAALVFGPR